MLNLQEAFERARKKDAIAPYHGSRCLDIDAVNFLFRYASEGEKFISCDEDGTFLDVDLDRLANSISDEDVEYLVACGVYYDHAWWGDYVLRI